MAPTDSPSFPIIFKGRTTERTSLYAAVGFFAFMMLVSASLLFTVPFNPGLLALVLMFIAAFGYFMQLTFRSLATANGRIELTQEGITAYIGANPRSLKWAEIVGVSRGFRGVQELRLKGSGVTLSLQLMYLEDGKELGRILDRMISGTPVPVPAAPVAPTAQTAIKVAPRDFTPKNTAWGGPFAGILMFGTFLAFGIYFLLTAENSGQEIIGVIFTVLFGFFVFVSVVMLLASRTRYAVDEHGIEARTLFGSKRMEWADVSTAFRKGSELTAYQLEGNGKKLSIETNTLTDGHELLAAIDSRLAEARSHGLDQIAGRAFRVDRGFVVMTVLMFGIFGPLMLGYGVYACTGHMVRPHHPEDAGAAFVMGLMYISGGALLVVMIPATLMRRYTPHAHSLEVRSIKGIRNVDYDRLTRVELGVHKQPKSSTLYRTMTLEHPDGAVRINSNIQDFGALQDYILAHVNPAIIRDSRPPGG